MKVDVYRNLHTKTWSVRANGRVCAHPDLVVINNAKFVVQPAGWLRVWKTGRKNVHAFVRGEWDSQLSLPLITDQFIEVTYNPWNGSSFMDLSGNRIYQARQVILTKTFKCFALI